MAVQSTSSSTVDTVVTPAPEVRQPTVSAAPGGTHGFGSAPNIMSTFASFGASANLGGDVDTYLETIRKALAGTGRPFSVDRISAPNIIGGQMVSLGDVAIPIVFPKLQTPQRRSDTYAPYGEWLEVVKTACRKEFPNLRMINGLVVMPDDLARADKMVTYLRDALTQANDSALQQVTAALLASVEIGYESNAAEARNLTATHFPQAVLPRADGGLVLRMRPAGSRGKHGGFGLNALSESAHVQAWVTAYVDFISNNAGLGQDVTYTPVVHITSIQSRSQDRHSMMLALAAALDWYITRNGWVELVANFNPASRLPNIGNLLENADRTVFFAENLQAVSAVVKKHCPPPTLVIDFLDGQAHIPALSVFTDTSPKASTRLADYIMQFFGTSHLEFKNTNRILSTEYVGSVNTNGQIVDSRTVTYLDVLARSQAPVPDATGLLGIRQGEPAYRAQIISQLNPTFEPIYQAQVIMPCVDLLMTLNQLISATGFPLYCETNVSSYFSANNYTSIGEPLTNLSALQPGGQMGQPTLRMGGYAQF